MHIKRLVILVTAALFCHGAMAQINLGNVRDGVNNALNGEGLSAEEVGKGLKEALTNGVSTASDLVSQADGYYKNTEIKIPFPPEVKMVEDKLRQMGMGDQVDKFILSLNRAAEDAAKEAKPIFVSAVKEMTIRDAWDILKGEDDAATQYLSRTTSSQLHSKFKPVITKALEKNNATKYYSDLVGTYNKVPFVKKVNPELDDYATEKAVDGIFVMVSKEEKKIRQNPSARATELMKKVFKEQD